MKRAFSRQSLMIAFIARGDYESKVRTNVSHDALYHLSSRSYNVRCLALTISPQKAHKGTHRHKIISYLIYVPFCGNLPDFQIMHLPGDHTSGGRPGMPTPKAHMADNDLALGRIVEAVSNSPYWKDTVLFVLEDDAQDGPDHVDSHRSVLLVISAYNRGGLIHRFVNTTDVFATMEEILGLGKLSKFDYYGRALREMFTNTPNLTPYVALKPDQPLDELNPAQGPNAQASLELNF